MKFSMNQLLEHPPVTGMTFEAHSKLLATDTTLLLAPDPR